MEFFSVPYFPIYGLMEVNMEIYGLFSLNMGKYGLEKFRIWTLHKVLESSSSNYDLNEC